MGNHRFRLSDMIPNAWFYKLKDMSSKTRNQNSSKKKTQNQNQTKSNISQPRQSYYYTRDSITNKSYKLYNSPANSANSHFLDPPRRSCRRRSRRKTVYRPSPVDVTAPGGGGGGASVSVCTCGGAEFHGCSPFAEFDESPTSEFDSDNVGNVPQSFNGLASWSSSGSCTFSSSTTDIVLDVNEKSGGYDAVVSELDLPPILTKPTAGNSRKPAGKSRNSNTEEGLLCFKEESGGCRSRKPAENSRNPAGKSRNLAGKSRNTETEEGLLCFKEESGGCRSRKSFSGVKLRVNSPKIGSRKIQGYSGRKSSSSGKRSTAAAAKRKIFSGSFAVVKASFDPEKDFKESMMEMIVENNIKASKDLEELLACYLSLNSDQYHALIIKAFQQIWFNLFDLHL